MARYARIADGRVAEIIELEGVEPSAVFHPDIATSIVAAGASVEAGWSYSNGKFTAPPSPAPPSKAELIAYAAAARFIKETGGIEVNGAPIATDRESQAMISGAFSLVQVQPDTTIRFKTPSGFVALTAAQMSAVAVAVAQHVQACFGIEADVVAEIEAGEIANPTEIETRFGQ